MMRTDGSRLNRRRCSSDQRRFDRILNDDMMTPFSRGNETPIPKLAARIRVMHTPMTTPHQRGWLEIK
jgi:hypothetical protein